VKVKWLGHASMLITSNDGVTVITDPYETGAFGLDYAAITDSADVVTVSHDHADHSNALSIRGNPHIVKDNISQKVKGVEFRGIASYHDSSLGKERGLNSIFCFSLDGIRLCHLGDLGHSLSSDTRTEIGPVDLLMIPVGGSFTIDARVAADICRALNPKVVLPMHYCNDRCPQFPVAGVDEFLKLMENVRYAKSTEVELTPDALPRQMEVAVLDPAL